MRRLNLISLGQGDPETRGHWNRKELLIDGVLLQEHLKRATKAPVELVSPLGWVGSDDERHYLRQLLLMEKSELPSGRQVLLVCPLCASLGCGCISARIEVNEGRIYWSEIGYENDYEAESLILYGFMSFAFDLNEYEAALTGRPGGARSHVGSVRGSADELGLRCAGAGMTWPNEWSPIGAAEGAGRFDAELKRELAREHPLHDLRVAAIGRRFDRDEVLFQVLDGGTRVAEVHLTWSRKREPPPWPLSRVYETWTAWAMDAAEPES